MPRRSGASGEAGASADGRPDATNHGSDGLRTLLRSARGTAALLAKHSAAAQSLVTDEEDAIDAMLTCCASLLQEHGVELDAAMNAIRILAALAEGEHASWRDLARLREQPLSAALADCDEHLTQQLHTIAEVLQFPKPVSLLLQRQLAVFPIRRDAAGGGSATAALVRAEAVLAPLLEQAGGVADTIFDSKACWPSGLTLRETPAFWIGFFGDPEDPESLDTGLRELDHTMYGTGRLLGGRGLLPDLLQAPAPSCAPLASILAAAAAGVGDVATIAALHHAGRELDKDYIAYVAAKTGQVEVIRLALTLYCDLPADECLQAAAEADISSDTRLQILSIFKDFDPELLRLALPDIARCGDVPCVQLLLRLCDCNQEELDDAVVQAAAGGHILMMTALLEHRASLSFKAFQASANVAVLQWCVERGCSVDAAFVKAAAVEGRVFQLKWAASQADVSGLLTAEVFAEVAAGGHVPSMEWLLAQACPWDSTALVKACSARNWESIALALRHGCPLYDALLRDLAGLPLAGLKAAVQALHDSGRGEAVNLPELFRGANRADNMEAAEWLVCDLGFPLSTDDCVTWAGDDRPLGYHAAVHVCLRLLQHLHSKGLHTLCPADMRAVLAFSPGERDRTRSIGVVRWLHAQGVPLYGLATDRERKQFLPPIRAADAADFLTFEAARRGALELLQVLVEECGAHWTESACVAAAEEGHLEVLRWAISKHCPCGVDTWCAAVRRGGEPDDYRPLALLHSAKRPWTEAVWAAAAPYAEVQAWLKERGCPGSQEAPAAGAGAGAGAASAASAAASSGVWTHAFRGAWT